jgi:hypothetical protein
MMYTCVTVSSFRLSLPLFTVSMPQSMYGFLRLACWQDKREPKHNKRKHQWPVSIFLFIGQGQICFAFPFDRTQFRSHLCLCINKVLLILEFRRKITFNIDICPHSTDTAVHSTCGPFYHSLVPFHLKLVEYSLPTIIPIYHVCYSDKAHWCCVLATLSLHHSGPFPYLPRTFSSISSP